jgi:hypothetical protein
MSPRGGLSFSVMGLTGLRLFRLLMLARDGSAVLDGFLHKPRLEKIELGSRAKFSPVDFDRDRPALVNNLRIAIPSPSAHGTDAKFGTNIRLAHQAVNPRRRFWFGRTRHDGCRLFLSNATYQITPIKTGSIKKQVARAFCFQHARAENFSARTC